MSIRKLLACVAVLAVFSSPVSDSIAGDLGQLKADLHSDSGSADKKQDKSQSESSGRSHVKKGGSDDRCSDDDETLTSQLAGFAFLGAGIGLASPFWAPVLLLNDDLDRHSWFPKHPYENIDGALTHDDTIKGTHNTAVTLQGVYGTDLSDMMLFNGRALVEHSSRFGIDSEFNYRREKLGGGNHDQLWNGDFNVTYRFAHSEHWLLRAGLGMNWLGDQGHGDVGFNFTYGVDWYPVDPVIVSGVIDWGRIGGAGLFHGRSTIGFTRDGWGAFTGYDYFRISDSDTHSWITGIELRF